MSQAPPPPPPHGENPKTTAGGGSGLPPGKYDIFIIPEHSAGSGFLYLPSLKPQWNSFIAGVASTLMAVVIGQSIAPALKAWWAGFQGIGNAGLVLLMLAIGLGAWSLGKSQSEKGQSSHNQSHGGSQQRPGGAFNHSGGFYTPPPNGAPPPNTGPQPPPPPPHSDPPKNDRPNPGQSSWQEAPRPEPRPQPQPQYNPPPPPPPQPEPQRAPEPEPPKPEPPKPEPPKPEPPKAKPPPPQPQPTPKPQPQAAPKPQPQAAPNPPPPRPSPTKTETPKGAWEKAREETRRREEERKAKEAENKRREEAARRLAELREKDKREREQRERLAREKEARERLQKEQEAREKERLEREKERLEKELREKVEKELREKVEREAREKVEREAREKEEARKREEERARLERERQAAREREARERAERLKKEEEEKNNNTRKGSTYAFSSVGERTSMWPNGRPPAPASSAPGGGAKSPAPAAAASPRPAAAPSPSPSPTKPAPQPAPQPARSATGTEDTYSYRPYDKPKKPTARKKSVSDFSESSWAPSSSTARTTPPPSVREPYTTTDPNKIVIKAVYGFLNQFSKTPASQLVSGVGTVTDGLILRINSAGLFVDDDVRDVPQREWDVKAWTIKLIEVWCPTHAVTSTPGSVPTNHPFFKSIPASHRRAAERGATKTFVGEEAFAYLEEFGKTCKTTCALGPSRNSASGSSVNSSGGRDQTGEWKAKGLHLLRVTMRDQEGKRHLFVVNEEESWKIARGLQQLRSGSQVRALNCAGFSGMEAKNILETLGWG